MGSGLQRTVGWGARQVSAIGRRPLFRSKCTLRLVVIGKRRKPRHSPLNRACNTIEGLRQSENKR